MTLTELGLEYLNEESQLRKRLGELMKQYKECDSAEGKKALSARIYYLRREIFDCHEWGEYLISYYNDDLEEKVI